MYRDRERKRVVVLTSVHCTNECSLCVQRQRERKGGVVLTSVGCTNECSLY